jgi:hypothetical protein
MMLSAPSNSRDAGDVEQQPDPKTNVVLVILGVAPDKPNSIGSSLFSNTTIISPLEITFSFPYRSAPFETASHAPVCPTGGAYVHSSLAF